MHPCLARLHDKQLLTYTFYYLLFYLIFRKNDILLHAMNKINIYSGIGIRKETSLHNIYCEGQ